MKTNQKNLGLRKVLVTMIYYLSVILVALLMVAFPRIVGCVAVVAIALSAGRLVWMWAWGAAKNGRGWRV